MEEQILEFRVLLVQLSNQLSDGNREDLHFIVGSLVPRKLRDDCTPSGTLHLLEFLFDRTLISDQHFDYLIHAFHEIGCCDAVERLKEFKRFKKQRTLSTASTGSTTLNALVSDIEADRLGNVSINMGREISCSFSTSEPSSPNSDSSSLPSKTIVSSKSQLLEKSDIFYKKKYNRSSSLVRKVHKAQLSTLAVLLLVTNILSILFFSLFLVLRPLKCPTPRYSSPAPAISRGETMKTADDIETPTICDCLSRLELVYVVKEGFRHGIEGNFVQGQSFNDAQDLALSYADRCIGVELHWVGRYLDSIRFFYSNGRSSAMHRPHNDDQFNRVSRFSNNFTLNPNEEINKVIFYERAYQIYTNDSLNNLEMKDLIVGIQFRTTKGRKSALFGSDDGKFTAESFAGYRFGYAKGRQQNAKWIEMLQFVWFKSTPTTQQITELPVYALETCAFNYTSDMDFESKYAMGVECSWYDLKREFHREGDGCRPGASYYRTISVQGPYLFAVVQGKFVFYHDAGKWTQYKTANSVTFGVIHSSNLHPSRLAPTFIE